MTTGEEIFRRLQSGARSTASRQGMAAPTQKYLTRHVLESFLDRLTRTPHADDFILKGGILLAACGVRRPTKDADANAVNVDVTVDHLATVVRDIAEVAVDDGVVFNLDATTVQDIREQAEYPGLRVRVPASIGTWKGVAVWDVSAGEPIVPPPRKVTIDRILVEACCEERYRSRPRFLDSSFTRLYRSWRDTRHVGAPGGSSAQAADAPSSIQAMPENIRRTHAYSRMALAINWPNRVHPTTAAPCQRTPKPR